MRQLLKKRIVKKLYRYVTDKDYRFLVSTYFRKYDKMPDDEFLKRKYKAIIGKELNLEHPVTFNEKLQWLKLNDRKPEYTAYVDKYAVRQYIAQKLGEGYLIPLLGVWDKPEDIDFDALPDKFVLKCTHNSGLGMCICKDKSKLNIGKVKKGLAKGLKQNYYLYGREWPYKDVRPQIVAEPLLKDNNVPGSIGTGLIDYKLYCFNGVPKFFYLGYANISNGYKRDQLTYMNMDWTLAPFYREGHEKVSFPIKKPAAWDEMVRIASVLSQNIPFVRVDLLYIDNRVLFSELTFSPGSGFSPFLPVEWEQQIGEWLDLPTTKEL